MQQGDSKLCPRVCCISAFVLSLCLGSQTMDRHRQLAFSQPSLPKLFMCCSNYVVILEHAELYLFKQLGG